MSTYEPIDTGDPEKNREINTLLAICDDGPQVWWWLSFCDTTKPEGQQFLGVSVVAAPNIVVAAMVAGERGCNPGGQVAGFPIPEEHLLGEGWRYRLLSKDDLRAAGQIDE